MDTFLRSEGRGVGELAASLDNPGMTLTIYALHMHEYLRR